MKENDFASEVKVVIASYVYDPVKDECFCNWNGLFKNYPSIIESNPAVKKLWKNDCEIGNDYGMIVSFGNNRDYEIYGNPKYVDMDSIEDFAITALRIAKQKGIGCTKNVLTICRQKGGEN